MLKYKAEQEGKVYLEVDRFFPSSKTCNNCLYQVSDLPLDIRHWECPSCGMHRDRDINAARNIEDEGLRILAVGYAERGVQAPELSSGDSPLETSAYRATALTWGTRDKAYCQSAG